MKGFPGKLSVGLLVGPGLSTENVNGLSFQEGLDVCFTLVSQELFKLDPPKLSIYSALFENFEAFCFSLNLS